MMMKFSKAGFQKQKYFFIKTSQESWFPSGDCFKRLELKIFSASARGTQLHGSFVFSHIRLRRKRVTSEDMLVNSLVVKYLVHDAQCCNH